MFNKIFLIIILLIFSIPCFANYNDIFIADIQYDWIDKSQMEKEIMINEIKDEIFKKQYTKIENFKSQFQEKLKDKKRVEHYLAASSGYKEYEDKNISAFYYKKMKNIYMYALQDKKDLKKAYYYDVMGNLRYVDFIEGEYPDFPYYSVQYKINGEPISVIYTVSEDCQYLFKPTGEFEGVWYKHNLYNQNSKVILTRTTY